MRLINKEQKRLYDMEYRRRNRELIKEKKRKYYASEAGKFCQAKARKKRIESGKHTAYCARPEQKLKTKVREHKVRHGEFRDCYEILREIQKIVIDYYNKNNNGMNPKYIRLKERGYIFNKHKLRKSN